MHRFTMMMMMLLLFRYMNRLRRLLIPLVLGLGMSFHELVALLFDFLLRRHKVDRLSIRIEAEKFLVIDDGLEQSVARVIHALFEVAALTVLFLCLYMAREREIRCEKVECELRNKRNCSVLHNSKLTISLGCQC